MYVCVLVLVCAVEESESEENTETEWTSERASEWMSKKQNETKRNETSVGIVRDIAII